MGPEPVVAALDDGRLLLVLDVVTARDVVDALSVAQHDMRTTGTWWRSGATGWLIHRLSGVRPPDTPLRRPISAASVGQLLEAGTLVGMRVEEAMSVLGLGRTRVYDLRQAGVLRPAGRGRVLAVDVEQLAEGSS